MAESKLVMLVDTKRCIACNSCAVACKVENNLPKDIWWNRVMTVGGPHMDAPAGTYPNLEMYNVTVACQHCENPACVAVCPTGASHKLEDGTVQVDKEKCIGCQFCAMSCPYGVRYLNEEERVVEKCTLCQQRTAQGELPQCVSQCCGMARWYGDAEQGIESFEGPRGERLGDFVNDFTEDQVYKLTDVGNGPSMFYIMRNIKWQGVE